MVIVPEFLPSNHPTRLGSPSSEQYIELGKASEELTVVPSMVEETEKLRQVHVDVSAEEKLPMMMKGFSARDCARVKNFCAQGNSASKD